MPCVYCLVKIQGVKMADQEKLVDEIKSLSDSIRRKHRALRLGVSEREQFLESTFKPVIGPLSDISKKLDSKPISTTTVEADMVQGKNDVDTDDMESIEEIQHEEDYGSPESEQTEPSRLSLLGTDIASKGLLTRKYVLKMLHQAPSNPKHHVYGARMTDHGLMIGSSPVDMDSDDNLIIGGKKYEGTKGLFELLFKQLPIKFTAKDLKTFKHICKDTNAHKKKLCKHRTYT